MKHLASTWPVAGAAWAAWAYLAASGALAQGASDPRELFADAVGRTSASVVRAAISVRPVDVRLDLLASLRPSERFTLNLSATDVYTATVERVTLRAPTRYTIVGTIDEVQYSEFLIVVEDEVAIGYFRFPMIDQLYRLRYSPEGVHLLCQIDPNRLGACADNDATPVSPAAAAHDDAAHGPSVPPPGPPERGFCNADPSMHTMDLIIAYTDVARIAAGGVSAINAECQAAIDTTNLTYANSAIYARARLVYRGEVAYNEVGTLDQHRDRLAATADGVMDSVHALRETYRADHVSLLVDDDDGVGLCGIAYCLPNTTTRAFNIVNWECSSSNYSFPHELGHNQGCAHDRANAGTGCNAYTYSYGWRFVGNSGTTWRTVMAYAPGTRIGYFSDCCVLFDGQPTGVPIGFANESDNSYTINQRAGGIVVPYRLTRFDVWVQFGYSGTEAGTFNQPYNTLAEGIANIIQGVGASERPTVWVRWGGNTAETPTMNQPMTLKACGGTLRIGQ